MTFYGFRINQPVSQLSKGIPLTYLQFVMYYRRRRSENRA